MHKANAFLKHAYVLKTCLLETVPKFMWLICKVVKCLTINTFRQVTVPGNMIKMYH